MSGEDFFADITRLDNQKLSEGLYEPAPPEINVQTISSHDVPRGAPVYDAIDTEEKLQEALVEERLKMGPFLENHAPKLLSSRRSQRIDNFDWRVETEPDCSEFTDRVIKGGGEWESVTIPHYGAPMGKATTFYRTKVELRGEDLEIGGTHVCFKGVDYIAHVYFNGAYVGRHEGFFAPFEFDVTKWARCGENTLVIRVDNDAINMGNRSWGNPEWEGDKLYGATGPGWDDPHAGWHHCPPGMGIYQHVTIEHRPSLFIHDVFVRPIPDGDQIEIWVEVVNSTNLRHSVEIGYRIHGRNFDQPNIIEGIFSPVVRHQPGVGDMPKPEDNQLLELECGPGVNYFKIPLEFEDYRTWSLETPWLYQCQVSLIDGKRQPIDHREQHFGMRSFHSDEETVPKGRFFLNDQEIRLRGTNTMGHLQQCVMKEDWGQLIDDILLAKLCNLNFFRMTQRPVQSEVYDYFDMLGILSQSDFPLFGCLRRNQFDEALRQVREMECLLRPHPSCVIISYMNEPFPNGSSKPHRNLDYVEQHAWYDIADVIVRQCNPERVIKAVDGDYDPPSQGVSDRHCYNLWYGNHGIDFGKFHRGYWQVSKVGWMHGCGEFGVEALDSREVMLQYYPEEWMTAQDDEGSWCPDNIPYNQTYKFHHLWYETPRGGIESWVKRSNDFQQFALRHIGEAFRRDNYCSTCAVHLFIDAFPSSWMKTIVDFHRKPKGGYFGIREAFAPLAVSIRTDRFYWYGGEVFTAEAWLANDGNEYLEGYSLHFDCWDEEGRLLASGSRDANVKACCAEYQGNISFPIPTDEARNRNVILVKLTLIDGGGKAVHSSQQKIVVFPQPSSSDVRSYCLGSEKEGEAAKLISFLGAEEVSSLEEADTIICDDFSLFETRQDELLDLVSAGSRLVLLSVPIGDCDIAGVSLQVNEMEMAERHALNRGTGHPMVAQLEENDLRFIHDSKHDFITPFCRTCILPQGQLKPIITSATGNSGFGGSPEWKSVVVVGELLHGSGSVVICQLDLGDRLKTNSTLGALANALMNK